nr:hypothetical protein HGMM_F04H05C11 [uncultured Gammaproteobacteria bacterium]
MAILSAAGGKRSDWEPIGNASDPLPFPPNDGGYGVMGEKFRSNHGENHLYSQAAQIENVSPSVRKIAFID